MLTRGLSVSIKGMHYAQRALSHPSGWRPRGGCQRRGVQRRLQALWSQSWGPPGVHRWFAEGCPPSSSLHSLPADGGAQPGPVPKSLQKQRRVLERLVSSECEYSCTSSAVAAPTRPCPRPPRPQSWGVMGVSSGCGTWTPTHWEQASEREGRHDCPCGSWAVSKGGRQLTVKGKGGCPAGRVGSPRPAWAVG